MIAPRGPRIFVSPLTAQKTDGGIYLPESAGTPRGVMRGKVVAIGPGARSPFTGERCPIDVARVGQVVQFHERAATAIAKDLFSVDEGDVLGVEE